MSRRIYLIEQELSIRHPKIAFTHAFPGFVDTNLAKGSYLGRVAYILSILVTHS